MLNELKKPRKKALRSFRSQLILALCVISAVPLLVIQTYSFYQVSETIAANTNELIEANMVSTLQNVTLTIEAYRSVLDQLYVDDTLIALVNKLNAGEDTALCTNQVIRLLRTACYAKESIQGITVVLADGGMVFYDKLTGSTIRNSWMEQNQVNPKKLVDAFSQDNQAHLIPTQFAAQINNERVFLFHVARRMIDYRSIDKKIGMILLSLDERLLHDAINMEPSRVSASFLIDREQRIVAAQDARFLGNALVNPLEDCIAIAATKQDAKSMRAYQHFSENLGWSLVCVVDQGETMERVAGQQRVMILILLFIILLLAAAITLVTGRLSGSVQKVSKAMRSAGAGDVHARISLAGQMPIEIAVIAEQFNSMMNDIEKWIEQVRSASEKQRDAEIALLEAQINPHFLYNTLDSINWMAIDEGRMEISGAITALARILRYSIDESTRLVPLREEISWLKQYLFLQQVRLKNGFQYTIDAAEELLNTPIHKLLFQPFVENAIRHGFEGIYDQRQLSINIQCQNDMLRIQIVDNGRGIATQQLDAIRSAMAEKKEPSGHIGILNAVARMRMYYGEDILIEIDSAPEKGTNVMLQIPLDHGKEISP